MTIGIYYLLIKNKIYVGQSTNIEKRIKDHISCLKLNNHYNIKLQTAYNEYKEVSNGLINTCPISELDEQEIFWIKELNSIDQGLNCSSGGIGGGIGSNNSNSRYTENQLISAFKLLLTPTISTTYISEITGVHTSTIRAIMSLEEHRWLEERFPAEYTHLREIKILKIRSAGLGNSIKEKGIKYPSIVSPIGVEYSIDNIAEFSRKHKLDPSAVRRVLLNKNSHHKGWTISDSTKNIKI